MRYRKLFMSIILAITIILIAFNCSEHTEYKSAKDVGDWIKMQDSSKIDNYIVFKGNVYCINLVTTDFNDLLCTRPLEGADAFSFEVCKGSLYARDRDHVYYPIMKMGVNIDSLWGSVTRFSEVYGRVRIDKADPKTFKYIGDGYGIDKKHMYYNGEEISWDDDIIRHQMEKHKEKLEAKESTKNE